MKTEVDLLIVHAGQLLTLAERPAADRGGSWRSGHHL